MMNCLVVASCTHYDASTLQALGSDVPEDRDTDRGRGRLLLSASSAINKIGRWLEPRGVPVCVIILRDNLNETMVEIWRHCDRG